MGKKTNAARVYDRIRIVVRTSAKDWNFQNDMIAGWTIAKISGDSFGQIQITCEKEQATKEDAEAFRSFAGANDLVIVEAEFQDGFI